MAIRRAGFDSSQEEEKMLNILLQDPDTMQYDHPFPQSLSFTALRNDFLSSKQVIFRKLQSDLN